MYSFREILGQQVDNCSYASDFRGNPYSSLKAKYYMFFASILVYFLQNKSVHPNTITKFYIFSGFAAAVLLAIPIEGAHYIALFIVFSKGILDWTDGHVARIKGMASLTGHILDVYGARIHSITFVIGLGIYQYFHFDNNELFLAALFIYPFFYGTLLTKFSNQYIVEALSDPKYQECESYVNVDTIDSIKKNYSSYYKFFVWFLDDRSRTIDFVCLLIFLEHFNFPSLSWLFFVGVNVKWIVLWIGSFYVSSKPESSDHIVASKIRSIKDV